MHKAYFPTSIPVILYGSPSGAGGGGGGDRCASSSIDHRTLEMLVSDFQISGLLESERPNVFYFSLKIF